ncbi:hypothetical protein MASR2M12_10530 [Bacteroidales bacterium]
MSEPRKPKRFINLPQYPGGKKAFVDFIVANLRYPEAAQQARIEGAVIVEYEIDSDGQAHPLRILKSIGYGCDEEAMRVVSLLRFSKPKNRGLRVSTTTKTAIHFRLAPQTVIEYSIKPPEKSQPAPQEKKPEVFGYTIEF